MDLFTYSNINLNSSFQRSTRIDNKITKEFLNHYIFHDTSKKVLDQISNSIINSNQSAFTLTGPYGTGKSSFLLAFEQKIEMVYFLVFSEDKNGIKTLWRNRCQRTWQVRS